MTRTTKTDVAKEIPAEAAGVAAENIDPRIEKWKKWGFSGKIKTVNLFYDGEKYKDPLFVQVNGRPFLVRRGEDVEVPEEVAEVIRRQLEQDGKTKQLLRELASTDQDAGTM